MDEQAGLIYYVDPVYIAIPNTSEGLRLFKNLLDGKFYLKKPDDTLELLTSGGVAVTEITLDITGVVNVDLSGYSGEIIVDLTSLNAAENIDKIINAVGISKVTLRPAFGLTVTFEDKSVGSPGSNLHLYAANQIANGTLHGFLEVQYRSLEFYETNFIDAYES